MSEYIVSNTDPVGEEPWEGGREEGEGLVWGEGCVALRPASKIAGY